MATCPGREGTYVPWSMGIAFACLVCGARVVQPHTVQPIRNEGGQINYESVYPIPEHEKKA